MTTYQTTYVDEITNDFLNVFQLLSRSQKTVFFFLQKFCQTSRNVFPSLEYIAEKCYCSRSTVKRAIAKFEGMGIFCHKKRHYQSNLYFAHDQILKINFANPTTFKKGRFTRVNEPQNEPVLYVSNQNSISRICKTSSMAEKVSSTVNGIDISQEMRDSALQGIKRFCPHKALNLTEKDLTDLIRNFLLPGHKAAVINALECLNFSKKKIDNPIGYLFKMCAKWKRKFLGRDNPPPE